MNNLKRFPEESLSLDLPARAVGIRRTVERIGVAATKGIVDRVWRVGDAVTTIGLLVESLP